MTRGGVFFFERRGIFIILIRSYFTTRNNQESGKREKIREVRVTHLSVSARTRWFVHLSVICENLATAVEQICPRSRPSFAAKWGQLETRTPTASLPHSAQIYSVALIEVDRCSPRQMSCQRFASFSLSSPTPFSFTPPNARGYVVSLITSYRAQLKKNRYFILLLISFLIPANNVYSCRHVIINTRYLLTIISITRVVGRTITFSRDTN